jgi:amino acid adenylation domain-containing protein
MTSETAKRNIEAMYPLSPMQQGMLFHSLYAPESGVYHEQLTCTLQGALNVSDFVRAWQRAAERHPVLRTSFVWRRLDKMLQVVHRQVPLPLEQHDWRALSPKEREAQLEAFLEADRRRAFNLAQAPIMRLALIQTGEATYQFVWSYHHMLLDGWSVPLLLREVVSFYEAFSRGRELVLGPSRPYRDYIAWLQAQDAAGAEAFWRRSLHGFTAPTPLVVDGKPGSAPDAQGGNCEMVTWLAAETTAALGAFARQHQLTLNTLVQGAWALLLSRYSGEEDVVFGATVSGRPADLVGSEAMIGLFINTLPVRVQARTDTPVVTWLEEIQSHQVEARQYEHSSLVQIQEWSDIPRGQPLLESIVVFENYPVDASLGDAAHKTSLEIKNVRSIEQTNYPLTVVAGPGDELVLQIAYDGHRFEAQTVRRMLEHLSTLLEGMAANPEGPVGALPLLTAAERQHLLVDWNATQADYPADRCVHELFEAQAQKTPEAVAVVFEEKRLTYAELNRRANQLAHHLQKLGVGPETLVGICVERSPEMIVGVLGVLKAGGAYVPLDPDYPPDRLAFMLEDTQVQLLLTQAHLQKRLPGLPAHTLCLDADWPVIARQSLDNPVSRAGPGNLAYVIYTSGSTGLPKGTLLQHRGLCNFINAFSRPLAVGPGSQLLQFASFSFDAAAGEVFVALLFGATLHLARREALLSILDLTRLLQDRAITVAILPPSLLKVLPVEELEGLQTLMSVGEACSPDLVIRWAPGRRFYNGYGPTEASIGTTWAELQESLAEMTKVSIGRPITNVRVYVLDGQMQPVPVRVPGELYIGGVGLARGYLSRPELTAERFVPDPFSGESGARLYRTGDLARYRADGQIEFLGRIDHQVKIRGFRVELGEIEAVLNQHPGVRNAVVLAREDGPGDPSASLRTGKYLMAYLVLNGETELNIGELRGYLKEKLPDYMLPSVFVALEELPLTPSGKVDRRVLPAPEGERPGLETTYVPPCTPEEEILAGIWARVLGVSRVGAHDNFFDLGGHSLLAVQLLSRVREIFQVELPLSDLFETPTVAELAEIIRAAARKDLESSTLPIEPVARDKTLPLSFAQQRLWFLDRLEPGSSYYNIPSAVRLMGALDVTALERTLNEIVRRHEVLRTTFAEAGGRPVQVIAPEWQVPLPVVDLSDLPEAERESEAQRLAAGEAQQPFDLAHGPLLRATLLKLGTEEHTALFTVHHSVADGWSVGVLIREIATLYEAFSAGKPSPLPELSIQYADYAHWQREWLQGEMRDRQLAYWRRQLRGSPPVLELPTDHPRPAVQSSNGSHMWFRLPQELSDAVKTLSRQEGVTVFMTLLAAFQTLLYRYTGQEDICVGTPIANRNRAEIEGLVGFFVNTLVMRTDLSGQPSFREVLRRVREVALGAYAHQDLPFEVLVEALQPQRDLSHTPLFQVMFVLDNTPRTPIELPGLSLSPLEAESGTAQFDFTLSMSEGAHGLGGYVEYNTDLFDPATVERMVGHFQTLLTGLVADAGQPISTVSILGEAERQQLLVEWNATQVDFPRQACIHHLFEAQVEERPNALAVQLAAIGSESGKAREVTYAELNRRANQLGHYLHKLGVGPEAVVGLSTERCLEMIVGILGVLKAGGAYLPLDPSYPADRLAFMLADARVPVLLTQAHLAAHLPTHQARVVRLDTDWAEISREPAENVVSEATADNLAYVIYTSGSTGQPKGALLRHRGLCSLAGWQKGMFGISEGSRVLQFSPLSFDASVWETFMALRNGATLVLAPQAVLASGPDLTRLLHQERVTHVTLPPSVLAVLPPAELSELRTVIAAGEACTADLVARWAPGRDFFNAYGPTETTVCAAMYRCDAHDPRNPPIGRPIANSQVYVLDRHLQPVPIGVPGELHVGGVGLARGYWKRPELTADRFIHDLFTPSPPFPLSEGDTEAVDARLYKTGDLVRWRADGQLEFLGRLDHQVKLRGFRIELGEIEAVLGRHSQVQDGVVIVREDRPGDKRLVAYLVPVPGALPSVGELKSYLRQTLPEYMLPSAFVMLERLPLSPSGKVDRRALPAPERGDLERERAYVAPRNEVEAGLAEMCRELLGLERVGVDDSFFELGGHSLLATQFISRVREAFGVELPLRTLFERPSVADLAESIQAAKASSPGDMDQIAALLEMVGQLSEEQVEKLLAEKQADKGEGALT